jgi:dTMP kinase
MFITFEGTEGCGKSTQINKLKDYLVQKGHDVVLTREPGGTNIADKIRKILVDATNKEMVPLTEVLLYYASRAQHLHELIIPSLKQGKIVLCDRFNDSSLAYQGYARGLDSKLLSALTDLVVTENKPNLTFLLDMPATEGLSRAKARAAELKPEDREDRFEQEALIFHEKVRQGFLNLAKKEPERFVIINANRSIDEIFENIVHVINQKLRPTSNPASSAKS